MEGGKLQWCLNQNRGISLIDYNKNIAFDYMFRAKDDLKNLSKQNNTWKVIISYYICYNSFTAVLYSYGIKSEIHSCTIELLKLFDNLHDFVDFFENLKELREDVQYYLKESDFEKIETVKKFVNFCMLELDELNQNKIDLIRDKISNSH